MAHIYCNKDVFKELHFANSRILEVLLKTCFSARRRGLGNFRVLFFSRVNSLKSCVAKFH